MSTLGIGARRTFAALRVRNFRAYIIGQAVSMSGTWMQSVALVLLVLDRLHGNGFDVGAVMALQFAPLLLFGTLGGLVADRADKRRLLMLTQSSSAALALALGLLTLTGAVTLWQVYLLATLLGTVNLFDNPSRQSFVSEMVGRDLLPNAVSLNSVVMNSARVIGPAVGGALIVTVGIPVCFLVNAGSFVAVIGALALMRPAELHRGAPVSRARGQVRDGLRYAWANTALRHTLVVVAVVGVFAFNFSVTLPLLAEVTFHGGPGTYSAFSSAVGVGAVVGGLLVASRSRPSPRRLSQVGLLFGTMILLVALSPTEAVALAALVAMGGSMIAFVATANATLQLGSDPSMRGRVMALYAVAFLGSTPLGGPLVGTISDLSNPRLALVAGGIATLAACVALALRHRGTSWAPAEPGPADATLPGLPAVSRSPEPVPVPVRATAGGAWPSAAVAPTGARREASEPPLAPAPGPTPAA